MNNKKRSVLKQAMFLLERVSDYVSQIEEDEQDALDNMPENLQSSDRYEKMENAIDKLEEAINGIDEVKENIESAMV